MSFKEGARHSVSISSILVDHVWCPKMAHVEKEDEEEGEEIKGAAILDAS